MSALFPRIPFYAPYTQDEEFTPYTIPTGLKYFECDFERTPQITYDGSNITTFTGPYNSKPAFTNATLANKPLWQPLAFNYRPCATFDGADSLRNTATLAALGWPTGGAYEIWALVEFTGTLALGAIATILNFPTSTSATSTALTFENISGVVRACTRVATGAASVFISNTSTDVSVGRHIVRVVSTGTTVRLDVDGIVGTPVACVASGWAGSARNTIGGSAAATAANLFTGNINYLGFFRPLPTFYSTGLYAALNKRKNAADSGEWPYPVANLVMDFDFVEGRYWSGSLGEITPTQAFTSDWSSGGTVFDGNGKLQTFAPNTVPIANNRGMWAQTSGSCRIDYNNALDNAAWVKTNITPAQVLPTAFSSGSVAGWRITATADAATITQDYTTITAGGSITMSLPHAMFYWDGTPLAGAIEITNDGFVTVYDIRPDLIANQWVQIGGTPTLLPIPPVTDTFGVRIAKSGDSIGFCLGSVERGYVMTTPILTPSNVTVNRTSNVTTVNTANFPSLWDATQFTVLVVCEPQMKPLPPFGSLEMPRTGWTVMEINNPFNITGTGIGALAPYGGAGEGSLMTLDSVEPGSDFAVGNRLTVGSGIGSYTDITSQESGTPGGAGTYRVFSILYPDGQTTPAAIDIQSRVKDAQGYGLNAALKPDDDFHQRIGLTITNELEDVSYGFDPQTEDYIYNEINSEGFSLDTAILFGIIALRGDIEEASNGPGHYTASPELESDIVINLGSQYPSGGPLDGVIQRVVIFKGVLTSEQLAAATLVLQARYAT